MTADNITAGAIPPTNLPRDLIESLGEFAAQYREGSISLRMLAGFVEDVLDNDALISIAQKSTRWGWIWADDSVEWMTP